VHLLSRLKKDAPNTNKTNNRATFTGGRSERTNTFDSEISLHKYPYIWGLAKLHPCRIQTINVSKGD